MLLDVLCHVIQEFHFFFFSSRRRHTRSVSAFLLNRSSDLYWSYGSCDPRQQEPYDQYHENSHAKHWDYHKTPLIGRQDRKSGSAGMPRPISYAVFCLKKKKFTDARPMRSTSQFRMASYVMYSARHCRSTSAL